MQPKIFILTGPIQTGKTTALLEWCKGRNDIQGILTPVIDGKRMFMDIGTNEIFAMEASEDEVGLLKVGRFVFSANAFERAKQLIVDSTNYNYLIIDEIGPLELMEDGLFTAVVHALQKQTSNIILVAREGLVEKVIDFFGINNSTIITKTALGLL